MINMRSNALWWMIRLLFVWILINGVANRGWKMKESEDKKCHPILSPNCRHLEAWTDHVGTVFKSVVEWSIQACNPIFVNKPYYQSQTLYTRKKTTYSITQRKIITVRLPNLFVYLNLKPNTPITMADVEMNGKSKDLSWAAKCA